MSNALETKLPLTSENILGERLDALRGLFPEVFTEGKVDFERLRAALGDSVETSRERYGLSWAGKSEAIRAVQTPSTGTLQPMPDESVNFETSENLIIEGDNLEVLKLLQKSYYGKVKMVYIDPPYNTGNEFIYPDDFIEGLDSYLRYSGQVNEEGVKQTTNTESVGRFHSRWMTMMYPRLFLARNLLKEDGVIFVSVDDTEANNLRAMMDEVFGEENFIDTIVWKKRYGGGAKEKYLVSIHEYVLFYAKNRDLLDNISVPYDQESINRYYTQRDESYDVRGGYRTHPLEATKSVGARKNLVYPIPAPDGTEIWPKRQWWWDQDRVTRALGRKELDFVSGRDGWTVHTKQYLRDEGGNERRTKPFSIIDGIYTQHGTQEIENLFGDSTVFPFPKPTKLIKSLLQIADIASDDTVLDFFAGSGTVAHSLLDRNKELGQDAKFILVQLPERIKNKGTIYVCDPAFGYVAEPTTTR